MARDVYTEHEKMTEALAEIDEMFEALDNYRQSKDKRHLFQAHSYEHRARKLMEQVRAMQNENTTENAKQKAA